MIFDLYKFSELNMQRCIGGFKHDPKSWSTAEWTNAIAGEVGEAANLAKKLIRIRDGVAGNIKPGDNDAHTLSLKIMEELADVMIYADLTIQSLGGCTADVVRSVFNAKSQELGVPYLLDVSEAWDLLQSKKE